MPSRGESSARGGLVQAPANAGFLGRRPGFAALTSGHRLPIRREWSASGRFVAHQNAITRATFQDLRDDRSWLRQFPWRHTNHTLLFDRAAQSKPAYDRLMGLPVTRFSEASRTSHHPQCEDHSVKAGSLTSAPPFKADSCAQRPTQVQLADWTAFGNGSRSATSAIANSCAR